jgi:hypothetical protein
VVGRGQGPAQAATPVFIEGGVWTTHPHHSPRLGPRLHCSVSSVATAMTLADDSTVRPYPTPGEAFVEALIGQLPPFRTLDAWWRRRTPRTKALYYLGWAAVVVLVSVRHTSGTVNDRESPPP